MKILSVVGARPQFIKAAPVSLALRASHHREYLVHTGQHYDYEMSQVFFDELGITQPDLNLEVGSGTHGWQTGQMLIGLEKAILEQKPDVVLVYGDTNSTLAGAIAAVKLRVPIAHVEAGLRSFNKEMPEEHNRVLVDHSADILFCPTQRAVDNLLRESVTRGVYHIGDTMYDAVLMFIERAKENTNLLEKLDVASGQFLLVTLHRPYNTDEPKNLLSILTALNELHEPVIFPIHPRTRAKIASLEGFEPAAHIRMIEPVGYLDMLMLEKHARMILTDSGGIQKEAFFFHVPCVTMRPETEWVETVETGWNVLVGASHEAIIQAVSHFPLPETFKSVFGDGHAAQEIMTILEKEISA